MAISSKEGGLEKIKWTIIGTIIGAAILSITDFTKVLIGNSWQRLTIFIFLCAIFVLAMSYREIKQKIICVQYWPCDNCLNGKIIPKPYINEKEFQYQVEEPEFKTRYELRINNVRVYNSSINGEVAVTFMVKDALTGEEYGRATVQKDVRNPYSDWYTVKVSLGDLRPLWERTHTEPAPKDFEVTCISENKTEGIPCKKCNATGKLRCEVCLGTGFRNLFLRNLFKPNKI